MRIGDVVKHKENGELGTVHYSAFGFSIHTWDEERQILVKESGENPKVLQEHWEVVDLPKGYEKMSYGGVRKVEG